MGLAVQTVVAGLHAYDKVVYFEVVVTPKNGAPWQVLRTPALSMYGDTLQPILRDLSHGHIASSWIGLWWLHLEVRA